MSQKALQGSFLLSPLSNKERKLCAHPRLEIYQQDQIYFMCPLARQGDFYVPEVKETERKSRGPAEASDTHMDGTGTGGGGARWACLSPLWACALRSGGSSLAGLHCVSLTEVEEGELPAPGPAGSYLFPDTWVHVGEESYVLPLAARMPRFCPGCLQMQQ